MKIGIIGANGKAGSLIAKVALDKGYQVTAIVRDVAKTDIRPVIEKSILELTKEELAQFDIVVSAFGISNPDQYHLYTDNFVHLAQMLSGTNTKLYIVGGAGSLYTSKDHRQQRKDDLDFPVIYREMATAMSDGLERLRTFSTVNWTFISPADFFDIEGPYTGQVIIGGEDFLVNDQGKSYISYEDYSHTFVDLFEEDLTRQRIHLIAK